MNPAASIAVDLLTEDFSCIREDGHSEINLGLSMACLHLLRGVVSAEPQPI